MLYLWECIRLVPAGRLILARRFGGGFGPATPLPGGSPSRRFFLPTAIPFHETIDLPEPALSAPRSATAGAPQSSLPLDAAAESFSGRLAAYRAHYPGLACVTGALFITLFVVTPLITRRFGGVGFLASIAAVVLLTALTGVLAARAMRAMGSSWSRAWRHVIVRVLAPTSALRVQDSLASALAEGVPALVVAKALLPPAELRSVIRVQLYDLVAGEAGRGDRSHDVLRFLGDGVPAVILDRPEGDPDPIAVCFCRRCGGRLARRPDACPECGSSDLMAIPA